MEGKCFGLAVNGKADGHTNVSVNEVRPRQLSARQSLGMDPDRPIREEQDDSFRVGWLNSGANHLKHR